MVTFEPRRHFLWQNRFQNCVCLDEPEWRVAVLRIRQKKDDVNANVTAVVFNDTARTIYDREKLGFGSP